MQLNAFTLLSQATFCECRLGPSLGSRPAVNLVVVLPSVVFARAWSQERGLCPMFHSSLCVFLLGFAEFGTRCQPDHCVKHPQPIERRAYLATGYRWPGEEYTWDGPPGWFGVGYDIYTEGPIRPSSFGEFVLWGAVALEQRPTWADLFPINGASKWEVSFSRNYLMSTSEPGDVAFFGRFSRFNSGVPCDELSISGTRYDPSQDFLEYVSPPYMTCQYELGGRPYDGNYSARFEADPMAVDIWQFHGNRFDRVPESEVPLDSEAPAGFG